jgi:hypothetical protein
MDTVLNSFESRNFRENERKEKWKLELIKRNLAQNDLTRIRNR